jgi:hypothetical protein
VYLIKIKEIVSTWCGICSVKPCYSKFILGQINFKAKEVYKSAKNAFQEYSGTLI